MRDEHGAASDLDACQQKRVYWEIFPSTERNIFPKESWKFLGDAVLMLKLLVLEGD